MKSSELDKKYGILKSGLKYEIIRNFKDYDNCSYKAGQIVNFYGSKFLPYENGLTLFFSQGAKDIQIRLQVIAEEQEEIAHNLNKYFKNIG